MVKEKSNRNGYIMSQCCIKTIYLYSYYILLLHSLYVCGRIKQFYYGKICKYPVWLLFQHYYFLGAVICFMGKTIC